MSTDEHPAGSWENCPACFSDSPPFVPPKWLDGEDMAVLQGVIDARNAASFSPFAAQVDGNDNMDIDPIEPLAPATSPAPLHMTDDNHEGIYIPRTADQHTALVHRFWYEIHQDWLDDERARNDAVDSVDPMQYDLTEMAEAVCNENQHGCRPYPTRADMMRHDWNRRQNCIYTIGLLRTETDPTTRSQTTDHHSATGS